MAGSSFETAKEALEKAQTPFSVQQALTKIFSECKRPNTAEKLLHRLLSMADSAGKVGPYLPTDTGDMPVREALARLLRQEKMFRRDDKKKRKLIYGEIVREMVAENMELDEETINQRVLARIEESSIQSLKRNISTTITDLVQAGLIERQYAGLYCGHMNRGAGRHAVYRLSPWVIDKVQGSELTRQGRIV